MSTLTKTFHFEVLHRSTKSNARVGRITTPHGSFLTPTFVGVGTNGVLKSLGHDESMEAGLDLMFANTYHLMVQPGEDVVEKMGGIHRFSGRTRPIITDSGGFQVFSLAYGSVASELKSQGTKKHSNSVQKISEEGVKFRSYRDGRSILLTPETSIGAQKKIGADIMISFDELPPYHISADALKKSFERTHRWEKRSLLFHQAHPTDQALYSVIHGGINPDLRKKSCQILRELDFDGHAVGGSLGKNRDEMIEMLTYTLPCLPQEKPIHLLGIADLPSLHSSIPLGIDSFDSSYPTKAARHGTLLTDNGTLRIISGAYKDDPRPIEEGCSCRACRTVSRSFLHHLFKSSELLGLSLASSHNLYYMIRFMERVRQKILLNEL
ncbi:MAG: tRNA guanosine(34) transglycosylase Tgt [Chlamydiae bacterium]|nr:tRNA guanosine(34) transglycosylase Tgt [Chlamydiota bacterium]